MLNIFIFLVFYVWLLVVLITGGRIDMAHHDTKAQISLDETVEFAKAIQAAVNLTNEEDTLIVVTSDHSHTLTLSGYAARGNPILGKNHTAYSDSPFVC
jgi:alkaline phosphatase